MLKIREEQIEMFADNRKKELISRLSNFMKTELSQWSTEKKDTDINAFVAEMIDFSWNSNIYREENIKRLIFSRLEYKFDLTLSGYTKGELGKKNFDEDNRLNGFISSLTLQKKLKKIYLDTNLKELKSYD